MTKNEVFEAGKTNKFSAKNNPQKLKNKDDPLCLYCWLQT